MLQQLNIKKKPPKQETMISNLQEQNIQPSFVPPPITFIWFGPQVPQDYLIQLSSLQYPVQFLKNPPISRKFTRPIKQIQKADYYRLEYIYQNGGIYSDFDNRIDYSCLTKVLAQYKDSQKAIFWWEPKRNSESRNVVPNNFIFAPKPKMQEMKKILEGVDQNQKDLKFAGMEYLNQFANKELIQVKQLYQCIQHEYDFSWINESGNEVSSEGKKKQKQQLSQKKIKKSQILSSLQRAQKENVSLKRQYDILLEKYQKTDQKLIKEYKKHYVKEEIKAQKQDQQKVFLDEQKSQQTAMSEMAIKNVSMSQVQVPFQQFGMKSYSAPAKSQIHEMKGGKQEITKQNIQSHGYQSLNISQNNFTTNNYPQYSGPSLKSLPHVETNLFQTAQQTDDKTTVLIEVIIGLVVVVLGLIIILVIKVQKQKYRRYVEGSGETERRSRVQTTKNESKRQSSSKLHKTPPIRQQQKETDMNEDNELQVLKEGQLN